MDGEWTDLPLKNVPPPFIGQPPPPPEIKNILISPNISKFQLPLTLAEGAHYVEYVSKLEYDLTLMAVWSLFM